MTSPVDKPVLLTTEMAQRILDTFMPSLQVPGASLALRAIASGSVVCQPREAAAHQPTAEQEREEFEAWAVDNGYGITAGVSKDYLHTRTHQMWKCWQAARRIR